MIKEIHEERTTRINDLIDNGRAASERVEVILNKTSEDLKLKNQLTTIKAASIKHKGLTKNQYVSHLTRMIEIIKDLENSPSFELMQLAIIHNIKEVSKLPLSEIITENRELQEMNINLLAINRELQYKDKYLVEYYKDISKSKNAAKIKCIDKLDNLFLIGLNKDSNIREKYVYQIEKHVKPLFQIYYPELKEYLSELIQDAKLNGYMEYDALRIKHANKKRELANE